MLGRGGNDVCPSKVLLWADVGMTRLKSERDLRDPRFRMEVNTFHSLQPLTFYPPDQISRFYLPLPLIKISPECRWETFPDKDEYIRDCPERLPTCANHCPTTRYALKEKQPKTN